MAPLDYTPNHIRSKAVNLDNFISIDRQVILSKSPQIVQQPFLLLQIFNLTVSSTSSFMQT